MTDAIDAPKTEHNASLLANFWRRVSVTNSDSTENVYLIMRLNILIKDDLNTVDLGLET